MRGAAPPLLCTSGWRSDQLPVFSTVFYGLNINKKCCTHDINNPLTILIKEEGAKHINHNHICYC